MDGKIVFYNNVNHFSDFVSFSKVYQIHNESIKSSVTSCKISLNFLFFAFGSATEKAIGYFCGITGIAFL